MVQPVSIADRLPEGEDIASSVRKIWAGQSGVPSGMKTERLKTCIRESTREKDPDTER